MLQRILLIIAAFSFTLTAFAQGWEEVQRLVSPDREAEANFGVEVAIDGDYSIIGRWPTTNDLEGVVYSMTKLPSSGEWIESQQLKSSDISDGDLFGSSIAIFENTAFIGAPGDNEDENGENTVTGSGSVYIFSLNESSNLWEETQKIVAIDRAEGGQRFGSSIDVFGGYAIIGAPQESKDALGENPLTESGAAYMFKRDSLSGVWREEQKIVASDRAENRAFGTSVAIYGDRIIVGAAYASNFGAAYVYERQNMGVWTEVTILTGSDQNPGDSFGRSVDVYGDVAIVGASSHDIERPDQNPTINAGAAYLFKRQESGDWMEFQKLYHTVLSAEDYSFGISVALNDRHILVGATEFSYFNPGAGKLHTFSQGDDGTWVETNVFHPSYATIGGERFGVSVDIDKDQFIVGEPGLSELSSNGVEFDRNIGTAYIFEFTDTIVATQDISFDFPIKVYPNPTDGPIYVDMGISYPEIQVEISNSLGQTIYRKKEKTAQQLNLDLDGYPTGIYYISIQDGDGRSARIKVVRE